MPLANPIPGNPPRLPSPADRPDAAVVIYDGNCRFCTAQVARLARWDSRRRLAFLSLHEPESARRYPDLTREQLMEQMYLVDRRGTRHGGAAAFRCLTRRLPRLWGLAPLMHIPFSLCLWQWMYRQIAKRRYWLGKLASCVDGTCRYHLKE